MIANYCYKDIVNTLKKIGITAGDDVFIHSNLGFFGVLENCKSGDEICKNFEEAIFEVIGKRGTIVVPTFSYSYCHNELYNPLSTKTNCGMFSTYMLKRYPMNRSLDPNFSVCGQGVHMENYLSCNIHEAFGERSFWDLFMENNGKIICMNFDSGSTFIHYIERKNNVTYRYNKAFNGMSFIKGEIKRDYAVHFVFDGEDNSPSMERVDLLCKENNISQQECLGKGTILAFPVQKYFDFFSKLLKERPRVLCKKEILN